MRATGGERATIALPGWRLTTKLEIRNVSGSWIDLTNVAAAGGVSFLDGWSLEADIDNPVEHGVISLRRETQVGGTVYSLAPLVSGSTLNRDNAGAYAALADASAGVRIHTAITPVGVTPSAGDWHQMVEGKINNVNWAKNPITLDFSDIGQRLFDAQLRDVQPYGSDAGTFVEDTMRAILLAGIPTGTPTLSVPVSPGWLIKPYLQDAVKVFDAIRALALQIGWDLRYRWAGTSWVLTFYEPPRSKIAPDFVLDRSEYLSIDTLVMGDENVRNRIRGYFHDSAQDGLLVPLEDFDSASITKYGDRFMQFVEDETSNIDTVAEMTAMLLAAKLDLSTPKVDQEVRLRYFWPVQLHDLIQFNTHPRLYTASQNLAVTGWRHDIRGRKGTTTIRTRGQVAGAYHNWFDLHQTSGRIPNVPEILFVERTPIYDQTMLIGWRLFGAADSETEGVAFYITSGLSVESTVPLYSVSTGPNGEVEYWIPLTGPNKAFTVEVNQPAGGWDEVTFVPHAVYNPTVAHPRPGAIGEAIPVGLSIAPRTELHKEKISAVEFQVIISVFPVGSTIKFRWGPDVTPFEETWYEVTPPDGRVLIGDPLDLTNNPYINVSSGDKRLEYYGYSIAGSQTAVEPTHSVKFDEDNQPSGTVSVTEPLPGKCQISLVPDDDVTRRTIWKKNNAWPIPTGDISSTPDDFYRLDTGEFDRPVPLFDAPAGTDVYICVRFFDRFGFWSQVNTMFTMTEAGGPGGPAEGPAILQMIAGANGDFSAMTIFWLHNNTVESGTYVVDILVNGEYFITNYGAKLEYFLNLTPNIGAINYPVHFSGYGGVVGTEERTYDVEVRLRTGAGVTVASYHYTVSGVFFADSTGGGGTTPVTTPAVPVVTTGPAGSRRASAAWSAPTAMYELDISWEASEDGSTGWAAITDPVEIALVSGTTNHTITSLDVPVFVRCRTRYRLAALTGTWGAYSNVVLCPTRFGYF